MRDKRLDNRPTAPHELLLIRVGHHLWKEYKSKKPSSWGEKPLSDALETVWNAKEAIRVILRKEWLESCKNRSKHLAEFRAKQVKRNG